MNSEFNILANVKEHAPLSAIGYTGCPPVDLSCLDIDRDKALWSNVKRTRGGEPSPKTDDDAARRRVARLVVPLDSLVQKTAEITNHSQDVIKNCLVSIGVRMNRGQNQQESYKKKSSIF